jgi:hypothetical protein
MLMRLLMLLISLTPLAANAQSIGTITLAESPLKLLRGTGVFTSAEGVKLSEGDVIESAGPGLTQLEFLDGSILVLSGASRVFILTYPLQGGALGGPMELVVFSGWVKAETRKVDPPIERRYTTLLLGAATPDGTVVANVQPEGTEVFVESGSAKLGEVTSLGQLAAERASKSGEYVARVSGKPLSSSPRPPAAFVSKVPVPFRDTLPSRLAKFKGRDVQPKRERDASYEDVADLLKLPRNWRKGFVKRFQPRTKDAAFRAALDANMQLHPEWDRILHPEKYLPKKPPEPGRHAEPKKETS